MPRTLLSRWEVAHIAIPLRGKVGAIRAYLEFLDAQKTPPQVPTCAHCDAPLIEGREHLAFCSLSCSRAAREDLPLDATPQLSQQEAGAILGASKQAVQDAQRAGRIPHTLTLADVIVYANRPQRTKLGHGGWNPERVPERLRHLIPEAAQRATAQELATQELVAREAEERAEASRAAKRVTQEASKLLARKRLEDIAAKGILPDMTEITRNEAAALLGITPQAVSHAQRAGKISDPPTLASVRAYVENPALLATQDRP